MKSRVLLAYPFFTKPARRNYAPIGIPTLAAFLLRKHPEVAVQLLDYTVDKFTEDDWLRRLVKFEPEIIGISAITLNYLGGVLMAKLAKERLPDSLVVMGGVHIVTTLEESLKHCDVAVQREGEEVLCELVEEHELGTIKGISWKHNGRVIHNDPHPFISDLDTIPFPAYELFGDLSRYEEYPRWHIISSRGCPYACTFCTNPLMWARTLRARSPQNIVDEIVHLKNDFGVKWVQFMDDTINMPIGRALAICDEIIKRGLNKELGFSGTLRLNRGFVSQELFDKFAEAGFTHLGFGVESGSQKVLDLMRKKLTPVEVRNGVRMARKAGIKRLEGFCMVGNWGETIWDVMKTWWLTITTNMETGYSVCTPFPGTEFCNNVVAAGYLKGKPNWETFNYTSVTTRTNTMNKPTIFTIYCISIILQLSFAIFRGGRPWYTFTRIVWHAADVIRRALKL